MSKIVIGNTYTVIDNITSHGFRNGDRVTVTDHIGGGTHYMATDGINRYTISGKDLLLEDEEEMEIIEVKAKSVIVEAKDVKQIMSSLKSIHDTLSKVLKE